MLTSIRGDHECEVDRRCSTRDVILVLMTWTLTIIRFNPARRLHRVACVQLKACICRVVAILSFSKNTYRGFETVWRCGSCISVSHHATDNLRVVTQPNYNGRTLAIALHTFFTLVFRWRPNPTSRLPLFVISGIWISLALIVGISFATHRHRLYYGDTQYCE